jgi:hypothetical protein
MSTGSPRSSAGILHRIGVDTGRRRWRRGQHSTDWRASVQETGAAVWTLSPHTHTPVPPCKERAASYPMLFDSLVVYGVKTDFDELSGKMALTLALLSQVVSYFLEII